MNLLISEEKMKVNNNDQNRLAFTAGEDVEDNVAIQLETEIKKIAKERLVQEKK
jgi:hypothetical protein